MHGTSQSSCSCKNITFRHIKRDFNVSLLRVLKHRSKDQRSVTISVGFSRNFDSVIYGSLRRLLPIDDRPFKLTWIIHANNSITIASTRLHDESLRNRHFVFRVKYSCPISPDLLDHFVDWIMSNVMIVCPGVLPSSIFHISYFEFSSKHFFAPCFSNTNAANSWLNLTLCSER